MKGDKVPPPLDPAPSHRAAADPVPLPRSFFARDTPTVARELLGKVLVSRAGDTVTGGRIVETEAYLGAGDPGSHAATKGMTRRNAVMYGPPGVAYVYFTYGNHHMINLVTEAEGTAGAVLIRALEPLTGVEEMLRRRAPAHGADLANGPGKLAAALGIDLTDNGTALGAGRLTVCDAPPVPDTAVRVTGRVGLSDGHELELRYHLAGDPHVSKGRTGPRPPKRRGPSAGGTESK
jgi:DNA-3-methyladenine glycosylase